MSFTRANPAGWSPLDQFTAAQANHIDVNQSNAIDGAAGGEYTNSAPIGIGGSLISRSGGEIAVESGAALTASAGSSVTFSSDVRLIDGADVSLEENSEIKTLNARTNSMFIPLHIVRKFPTSAATFAGIFPADWGYVIADATVGQSGTTTNTEWVVFAVPMLPPSATITEVQMVIEPSLLHGALPAQMPQIRLVRYTATGARVVVGTQADTSASTAAYEAQHTVTLATTETAAARWYVIEICGEYGANSLTGMQLDSVILTYTTSRVNHQWFEVTLT